MSDKAAEGFDNCRSLGRASHVAQHRQQAGSQNGLEHQQRSTAAGHGYRYHGRSARNVRYECSHDKYPPELPSSHDVVARGVAPTHHAEFGRGAAEQKPMSSNPLSSSEELEAGEIAPDDAPTHKLKHAPIVWNPASKGAAPLRSDAHRQDDRNDHHDRGRPAKRTTTATATCLPGPASAALGRSAASAQLVQVPDEPDPAAAAVSAPPPALELNDASLLDACSGGSQQQQDAPHDSTDANKGLLQTDASGGGNCHTGGDNVPTCGRQDKAAEDEQDAEGDEPAIVPKGRSRWLQDDDSDDDVQHQSIDGARQGPVPGAHKPPPLASPGPGALAGSAGAADHSGSGGGSGAARLMPQGQGQGRSVSCSPVVHQCKLTPDTSPSRLSCHATGMAECRSTDEYERLNRISEGTFGVVYRAREKRTGTICALKQFKMEKERDGFPVTSIREINILLNLHHPNIVNVSEVVMGSGRDDIFMVMEFCDHDLKGLMNDKSAMARPFSVAETKCLMRQLLSGIAYLHDNWVVHRDLKTSNILYTNDGQLKICDFGLARQFGSPLKPYTQPVVTLWYRAPELLLGETLYSTAIDMWSVGCIMAELLTGKPLFDGQSEIEQLDKIVSVMGTPNEEVWPDIRKLPHWGKFQLRQMPSQLRSRFSSAFGSGATLTEAGLQLLEGLLAYDPKQRITAHDAMEHRWFKEPPAPQQQALMPAFRSVKGGGGGVVRQARSPTPPLAL